MSTAVSLARGRPAATSNGDRPRSGTDVRDMGRHVAWNALQCGLDQLLGLGARNQYAGSDLQGKTVKFTLPDDVLDGLKPRSPLNKLSVPQQLFGTQAPPGIRHNIRSTNLRNM